MRAGAQTVLRFLQSASFEFKMDGATKTLELPGSFSQTLRKNATEEHPDSPVLLKEDPRSFVILLHILVLGDGFDASIQEEFVEYDASESAVRNIVRFPQRC